MSFMKTNTVDITVDGHTYNSLTDFGLAIGNTDYISEPLQPANTLIYVPGSSKPLDITESVFGEQYFLSRNISIHFGGMHPAEDWDGVMSQLQTLFAGRIVQLTFANDPDWYWTGRAVIHKFSHRRSLGEFDFEIPYADPYKYKTTLTTYDISGTTAGHSQICVCDRMPVVPNFYATQVCTLAFGSITKNLAVGNNSFTDIVFHEGNNEIIVTGTGATVTVSYREGRL